MMVYLKEQGLINKYQTQNGNKVSGMFQAKTEQKYFQTVSIVEILYCRGLALYTVLGLDKVPQHPQ